MRILIINAKCGDRCSTELAIDGISVAEVEGYAPGLRNHLKAGDYISLKIDLDSGQILDWNKPSESDINEFFKIEEPE